MPAPTPPTATLDLLTKARAYLDEHPQCWMKNSLIMSADETDPESDIRCCALGALYVAGGAYTRGCGVMRGCVHETDLPGVEEAQIALEACLPYGNRTVAGYNDNPDTTVQDIISLYDCAIAHQESTEENS